jgi:hypothetical protein
VAKTQRTVWTAPAALVAVTSLGILAAMWHFRRPTDRALLVLEHSSAALCLAWSLGGWLLSRLSATRAGAGGVPLATTAGRVAVLRFAALALGLLAFVPMLYCAMTEATLRIIETVTGAMWAGSHLNWHVNLWPTGMADLALLAGATAVGRVQTRARLLNTALFWLLVFAGLWASLLLPSSRVVRMGDGVAHAVATAWSAGAVGLFAFAGGCARHRWRRGAWPHDLWKLASPLPPWPGFRYSASVVGVAVLILGIVHVTVSWTPLAASVAGASLLALAGRQWDENLADLGLALVTLAVVSLAALWRPAAPSDAAYFAEIFNRALLGLAIMAAFWQWLAEVWSQQLHEGRPWTTAGRLIRPTRRMGYLVAATGLLVSANLAMWPLLPFVGPDHSAWRWSWGLTADTLLVLALMYGCLRTCKPTLGWLCLLAVGSSIAFALTRVRGLAFGMWWTFHWPLVMTAFATICLLLATAVRKSRLWQPFWESFYLSGTLLLPAVAIMGVSLIEQLRVPLWVASATFGSLAGVYLLAALLPGPRSFVAVAVICALASVYMGVWRM